MSSVAAAADSAISAERAGDEGSALSGDSAASVSRAGGRGRAGRAAAGGVRGGVGGGAPGRAGVRGAGGCAGRGAAGGVRGPGGGGGAAGGAAGRVAGGHRHLHTGATRIASERGGRGGRDIACLQPDGEEALSGCGFGAAAPDGERRSAAHGAARRGRGWIPPRDVPPCLWPGPGPETGRDGPCFYFRPRSALGAAPAAASPRPLSSLAHTRPRVARAHTPLLARPALSLARAAGFSTRAGPRAAECRRAGPPLPAQVFEHVRDPGRAAAELASVTAAGGHVVWSAPFLERFHRAPVDWARFTNESAAALMLGPPPPTPPPPLTNPPPRPALTRWRGGLRRAWSDRALLLTAAATAAWRPAWRKRGEGGGGR